MHAPVRGGVRHALLDFDGTVSLLRDGWQDLMVPLMVEVLSECPTHESPQHLEEIVIASGFEHLRPHVKTHKVTRSVAPIPTTRSRTT